MSLRSIRATMNFMPIDRQERNSQEPRTSRGAAALRRGAARAISCGECGRLSWARLTVRQVPRAASRTRLICWRTPGAPATWLRRKPPGQAVCPRRMRFDREFPGVIGALQPPGVFRSPRQLLLLRRCDHRRHRLLRPHELRRRPGVSGKPQTMADTRRPGWSARRSIDALNATIAATPHVSNPAAIGARGSFGPAARITSSASPGPERWSKQVTAPSENRADRREMGSG